MKLFFASLMDTRFKHVFRNLEEILDTNINNIFFLFLLLWWKLIQKRFYFVMENPISIFQHMFENSLLVMNVISVRGDKVK